MLICQLAGVLFALALSTSPHSGQEAPSARSRTHPQKSDAEEASAWPLQVLPAPEDDAHSTRIPVLLGPSIETLDLQVHSVRSPEFRVRTWAANAASDHETPSPRTYRGVVAGQPGSRVAANWSDEGWTAIIWLANGETWNISPTAFHGNAPRGSHRIVPTKTLNFPPVSCGVLTDGLTAPPGGLANAGDLAGHGGVSSITFTCQIALDADYEFFLLHGSSVAAVVADIEALINGVDAIYQSEASIAFEITEIVVRTTPADPYFSIDGPALLGEFQSHWNSFQAGVVRDVAHLMTGKDLLGTAIGYANVGAVCNLASAYGLSQSLYVPPNAYALRVALTAHELAHNFNAIHCAPDSACDGAGGDPDCGIMCPCIGGCAGDLLHFGANPLAAIIAWRNGAFCLQQVLDTCLADLDADCFVDGADLGMLVGAWGTSASIADIDGSGHVDGADLGLLIGAWGACASGPDLVVSQIDVDPCANIGQFFTGTATVANMGDEAAVGPIKLGMSLSIDLDPHMSGDDIPMGVLDLFLAPPLQPGHTRDFDFATLTVPIGALLETQNFFVCADIGPPFGQIGEACEVNNCASAPVEIGIADVGVLDLAYPSPVFSGDLVPVTVTVANFGCNMVCAPFTSITACIGGGPDGNCSPFSSCWTAPLCLGPFETKQITIGLVAPPSPLNCGAADACNVSANLDFPDANGGNNFRAETIAIAEKVFDLDFWITSGDNAVALGDSFSYVVHVKNVGTDVSPTCAAFITGVTLFPGPGNWAAMLVGDVFTDLPALDPDEEYTKSFTFTIPTCCNICICTQYLKAEILYGDEGCDDDCGENWGNNFHQQPISITW